MSIAEAGLVDELPPTSSTSSWPLAKSSSAEADALPQAKEGWPEVGTSLDAEALQALQELRLTAEQIAGVEKLGVEALDDLTLLKEVDLLKAGLNLVQARKVMDMATGSGAPLMRPQDSTVLFDLERMTSGNSTGRIHASEPVQSFSPSRLKGTRRRESSRERRKRSDFWQSQAKGRPDRLIFVRHGESEANVNRAITKVVPDHALHLTANGRKQALAAGHRLKEIIGDESVTFLVSPYTRTLETMYGMFQAFDSEPHWREDVRIREQEHGNFDSPHITDLHRQKQIFGPFYYRFPEGESQADCYDRASSFYESLYRSWADNSFKNQVIVCHSMMILVMLMRLMRLPIVHFERLEQLSYCEFIVLERPPHDAKFQISYTWEHEREKDTRGLRVQPKSQWTDAPEVWRGDPDAALLVSQPIATAPGSS